MDFEKEIRNMVEKEEAFNKLLATVCLAVKENNDTTDLMSIINLNEKLKEKEEEYDDAMSIVDDLKPKLNEKEYKEALIHTGSLYLTTPDDYLDDIKEQDDDTNESGSNYF